MMNKVDSLCDNKVIRLFVGASTPNVKVQIAFYLNSNEVAPAMEWMWKFCGCNSFKEFEDLLNAPGKTNLKVSIISKLIYLLKDRIATKKLPKIPEHYRRLGDCWEIKQETGRLVGFYDSDLFVVVHGFTKKSNGKTKKSDRDAAEKRKKDYEKRKKRLGLS